MSIEATLIALGEPTTDWVRAKTAFANPKAFLDRLASHDKDNMNVATVNKLRKYTTKNE